jgi:hypothetical protein
LKVREHSEDLGVDGKIILINVIEIGLEVRIKFIWLRIGANGRSL